MYPRDLLGYGRSPVDARWPRDARLAVQFVLNYEEGGEHSVLHGDRVSESFLTEEPMRELANMRDISAESQYEYGSRAGFWRLYRLFTERGIPVTIFGISMALARNPDAVAAMKEAGWEIASHGLRWISYADMPETEEQQHIKEAFSLHESVTGERPLGWYTGRMSPQTRHLLVRAGGLLYDSDSFSDDLPYWVEVDGERHLVIPYTLDNNDIRYLNPYGYNSEGFSAYLRNGCDLLRNEGKASPKMMSVGLHCRIVGRPGRAADLVRFLDYVIEAPDVWLARRVDIARHWHTLHTNEAAAKWDSTVPSAATEVAPRHSQPETVSDASR